MDDLKEKVVEVLKTCCDPEIPVNVYELGLIYDVEVSLKQAVHIKMTLTSPACPVAGFLSSEIEQKVRNIPGVASARVEIVWDPPWSPSMMSEVARLELGLL